MRYDFIARFFAELTKRVHTSCVPLVASKNNRCESFVGLNTQQRGSQLTVWVGTVDFCHDPQLCLFYVKYTEQYNIIRCSYIHGSYMHGGAI